MSDPIKSWNWLIGKRNKSDDKNSKTDDLHLSTKLPLDEQRINNDNEQHIDAFQPVTNNSLHNEQLINSINEFLHSIEDAKKISRVYYKNTVAIEENSAIIKELHIHLEQRIGAIDEIRKSIEEMLIKQRQENGQLRRKANEWEQITVDFFQLLERAIDTEKDGNKALVKKIINEFDRLVKIQGIDRIIPQPNEPINEKFHEGVGVEESSDIWEGNILRCTQWGYRSGYNVIEKAKVVVAKNPNFSSTIIVKPKEEEVVYAPNNELLDSKKTEKISSLETQNQQTDLIQEETIRLELSSLDTLADSQGIIDTNLNKNREADVLRENNPELKIIDDDQKSEDG